MRSMPLTQSALIAGRAFRNYINDKPLVISFEVTHSCTCNCIHCDRGGIEKENGLLKPEDYSEMISSLQPSVAQVSGGEPLLREDVVDIVKAIKEHPNELPHLILVTNGSLLNEDKYIELKEAGINRFSVSLDFPNERHDEFRRHSGLYSHLEETIPRLAELGNNDIALNSAITSNNMPYLVDLANKAEEWGVSISYSAYGVLRTGNKDFFMYSEEELENLQQKIQEVIELKEEKGGILNSKFDLMRIYQFFKNGYIPNCKAGKRFLVVRPNGSLVPCSMRPHDRIYSTQEEMLEEFTQNNNCEECYVAIRAYSDKSLGILLKDSISFFFSNVL